MIWIDYTLLALLSMSAVRGMIRGFWFETYSVFIWMVGIGVGLFFCNEFSILLQGLIEKPLLKVASAFVGLLLMTLIVGGLIGYLLGETLTHTNIMERSLGVPMGIIRGVLIALVLVMLAGLTALPEEPWWREAKLISPLQTIVLRVCSWWSADLSRYIYYG